MCPKCGAKLKRDETGQVYCPECSWRVSIEDVT